MNSEHAEPANAATMPTAAKALIAFVAIYGLALRVWLTFGNTGALDSDMAVLGLMARSAQHGHFSVFHWGQFYGGAQETYIAAILGIFGGVKLHTLYATTILLSACVTVMVGLVAKELHGKRAGWLSAGIFWIWPGPFVWWSVKIGSNYWYAMVVALLAVYFLLRFREKKTAEIKTALLIGFFIGQAFWANPQTGFVMIPAVIYCAPALLRMRKRNGCLLAAVIAALVSSLPVWLQNIHNGWKTFELPISGQVGILDRIHNVAGALLPQIAGFQVPFTMQWLGGNSIGMILFMFVVIAALSAVMFAKPRPIFLLTTVVASLFVFTLSNYASFPRQPRYLLWIAPWVVMLITVSALRTAERIHDQHTLRNSAQKQCFVNVIQPFGVGIALVLICATVSTIQLSSFKKTNQMLMEAPHTPVPADDKELIALLDENHVKYYFGNYWLTYRVVFETNERIVGSPEYSIRSKTYRDRVLASGNPPHVFMVDSNQLQNFLDYCSETNTQCSVMTKGSFALVQPNRLITDTEFHPYVWLIPNDAGGNDALESRDSQPQTPT